MNNFLKTIIVITFFSCSKRTETLLFNEYFNTNSCTSKVNNITFNNANYTIKVKTLTELIIIDSSANHCILANKNIFIYDSVFKEITSDILAYLDLIDSIDNYFIYSVKKQNTYNRNFEDIIKTDLSYSRHQFGKIKQGNFSIFHSTIDNKKIFKNLTLVFNAKFDYYFEIQVLSRNFNNSCAKATLSSISVTFQIAPD